MCGVKGRRFIVLFGCKLNRCGAGKYPQEVYQLINKAHVSSISVTKTSGRFTYKMAAKTATIDMKQNDATVAQPKVIRCLVLLRRVLPLPRRPWQSCCLLEVLSTRLHRLQSLNQSPQQSTLHHTHTPAYQYSKHLVHYSTHRRVFATVPDNMKRITKILVKFLGTKIRL